VNEARAGAGTHASSARRGGWRAWAELLRAPLLLSPVADVLAGWALAFHVVTTYPAQVRRDDSERLWSAALESLPALGCAIAAGLCLLAAGMAQNALADRDDDALRKPRRPLPSGAVSPGAVRVAWMALCAGGLLFAGSVSSIALILALSIVALSTAYHYVLKRFRVPGCLALGTLRALDLLLGYAVVETWFRLGFPERDMGRTFALDPDAGLAIAGLYAAFMCGASLHASTDDEPASRAGRVASRSGLALQVGALALLMWFICSASWSHVPLLARRVPAVAGAMVLATWALVRLCKGWRDLPPGPLTGVMLSGLYLFDASISCVHPLPALGLGTAGLILALFGASRRMRRLFPPT